MPDNISEGVDTPKADAPQNEQNVAETQKNPPETPAKPHATLAESELESSLSSVLPLSPIGGESEPAKENAAKKVGEHHHGLRRGNGGGKPQKNAGAAASVGLVENPAEFKETLSGSGPKPREQRERYRGNFQRRPQENARPAQADSPAPAAANPDDAASEEIREKIENARSGGSWRIRETPEKNFHRQQSAPRNPRPKLVIEPAPFPEQNAEPTLLERLKNRIREIFKIVKKKIKKKDRKRGGKFRGKDNRPRKDFRNNGNGKNFNRNRPRNNNGYRGNKNRNFNNNGGRRQDNGGSSAPKA
ncbi:MAG: hypothetical protein LUD52_03460 [Opitutae bacterium]|nr:hypothetical protein [Opitutae bacterium]